MFKIFSKIRQSLLSEGKTGKYLKYATGEIILVVIGILIALQINNWNEDRKDRIAESAYLKDLLEDFEANLNKSKETTKRITDIIPQLIGLLEQSSIASPTISADSMNIAFSMINHMPTYTSTDRVYNNLIGSGDFKIITNSELKNDIAYYYKSLDLIRLVQSTHEMELVNSFQPYMINTMDFQSVSVIRVDDWGLPPSKEENRILDVYRDRAFRNIVILKLTILTDLLEQNRDILKINENLVGLLKAEIN